MDTIDRIKKVRSCTAALAGSDIKERNNLLLAIAEALQSNFPEIARANQADLEASGNLSPAMRHRLEFNREKLDAAIASIKNVAALPDPAGKVLMREELDKDLLLEKISVPIGVIGMVFEARPDALVQIASLCLKSGNCLVLKGGSEASNTNREIFRTIIDCSRSTFASENWIELLNTRDDVAQMLKAKNLIDLIIPRGSYDFVRYVMQNTSIPVLGHADGLCSMYIDKTANPDIAIACATDAKTNSPGTCNALENLIVHSSIAPFLLPDLAKAMEEKGVELVGDPRCAEIIGCKEATPQDWDTEYLGLKLSIRTVDSIQEAIAFIAQHTSHHTDAIITQDPQAENLFLGMVDSASVYCNCSTRFADGFRYGLGAEVGISTSKIHARGPVGLEGLMTTKYIVRGNGQIAGTYMGPGARKFIHRMLDTNGPSRILTLHTPQLDIPENN